MILAIARARQGKDGCGARRICAARRNWIPTRTTIVFNLGLLALQANDAAAAADHFREAVEREPDNPEDRAMLILSLEKAGKKSEAEQERETRDGDVRSEWAAGDSRGCQRRICTRLNRIKTELDVTALRVGLVSPGPATRCCLRPPNRAIQPAAHIRRGRQELSAGQVEAAEKEFRAALAGDPGNAAAHRGLGEIDRRQGKMDDAVKELQASLAGARFRRGADVAGENLSGAEEAGSGAGRSGARLEAGAKLCGSETIARALAECEAGRKKARRRCAMKFSLPFDLALLWSLNMQDHLRLSLLSRVCALARFSCACLRLARMSTPPEPLVLELHLDGEVEPILATYIDEGLEDAARRHASLVLITMDTPGGLSDSMKDMIQHILASPVPVAVYVSPTGARGASAGFYILLSADIAAMAPGTHTGAASPIMAIGGLLPMQIDEVFRKKINNDAMAFLRSFTERRGRNPALAEKAITEAKAFTEKEALEAKMIDLIASFAGRSAEATGWPDASRASTAQRQRCR